MTPAGRCTLAREPDPAYGTVFTLNEIKGKDWDIAIHRVALVLSEHRPERLRSSIASDRHITNGCVNVERDTISVLERYLTGRNIPVYILPQNIDITLTLFVCAKRVAGNDEYPLMPTLRHEKAQTTNGLFLAITAEQ
jgi:hypothetical protein